MGKSNFIAVLFQYVDWALHQQIAQAYQLVVNDVQVPFALAAVLSLSLLGFSIMQGWLQCPWRVFLQWVLRVALIYSFVMHWHTFSCFFIEGLTKGVDQLCVAFMDALHFSYAHHVEHAGLVNALQSLLQRFTRLGLGVWNRGTWHHFSPLLTGGLIWLFGSALVIVAASHVLMAKLLLNLLFMLAPFFVVFTLFKTTEGFFQRWLATIVGYSLIQLLVPLMVALLFRIAQTMLDQSELLHPETVMITGFIPVVMLSTFGIGLLNRVARLAESIGQGVSQAVPMFPWSGRSGGVLRNMRGGGKPSAASRVRRLSHATAVVSRGGYDA